MLSTTTTESTNGTAPTTSERGKQQKEWDRLLMPLSVITATSAAALAIPSPSGTHNLYWVASALYTAAFGLSLEAHFLIMYLTVFVTGSLPETIGRLANGRGFLRGMVGPLAFIVALPTAIATYSSMFLFAGLVAMTIAVDDQSDAQEHMRTFQVIVLVPVSLMFLCILCTVFGCEVFAWVETRARLNYQKAPGWEEAEALESALSERSWAVRFAV